MENGTRSARDSLAIVESARLSAIQRSRSPWWYFPANGAIVGAAIVAVLLLPGVGSGVAVLLMAIAVTVLEAVRRGITGTRVSEWRRGRASALAVLFAGLGLGSLVGGTYMVWVHGAEWAAWVCGVAIFAIIYVGGRVFERALRSSAE